MPEEKKESKVEQMDTTKEGVKAYLEQAGEIIKQPWHSQQAHKVAVGLFALDCLKITDQEQRNDFMKQFLATPSSFGANASAMGQALGRPAKAKAEELIAANF